MSFSRLQLDKHKCTDFLLEVVATLSKSERDLLLKSGVFSGVGAQGPRLLIQNYTKLKKRYFMRYLGLLHEDKKKGRFLMLNQFEYQCGHAKLQGGLDTKVDFSKLYSFFGKHALTCRGRAFASFQFPLKKYKPFVDLPYSIGGPVASKKVEICGFDLNIQAGTRKYKQSITVEGDLISLSVGLLDIDALPSKSLAEQTLKEMHSYAEELVERRI